MAQPPLEAPAAFRKIDRSRRPPSGVRFLPGDGRAAILSGGPFEVWDLATGELSHWVDGAGRFAWTVLPGVAERHLVGGKGGALRVVTGDSKVALELVLPPAAARFFSSEACGFWRHHQALTPNDRDEFHDYAPYTVPCSAAVDASGRIAAVAYGQSFVLVWSLVDGRLLACLGYDRPAERAEHLYRTHISPDGATVLTRSADGRIHLWDWRSGRELRSFRVADEGEYAVHPDGPLPFCAGGVPPAVFLDPAGHVAVAEGPTIGVYDAVGERVGRWRGHGDLHPIMGEHLGLPRILDIRLSADARRMLSVGVDASLRVWDTHLGEELWSVTPDPCCSDWADLSSDGRRVIWTGCPGTRLYDVD